MKDSLHIYTGDDVLPHFDFKIQSPVLGAFNPAVYGLLLNLNEKLEFTAGLIEEWSCDSNLQKYRFKLSDAKFHNGRNITAHDLEFSIVRGFLSSSENYNQIHFSGIRGFSNLKKGMQYSTNLVPGIKVLEESVIEIELAEPNGAFLMNFTMPFVPLVPIEELEDDFFTWKTVPVGAGPYKVESDYSDHCLVLRAVSATGKQPLLIELDNRRKRECYDIIFDEVVSSTGEMDFRAVRSQYPASISCFVFYRRNLLSQDINFRKAIYHGIDRHAIAMDDSQFAPADEMVIRTSAQADSSQNPYNLKLAKSHLEKVPSPLLTAPIKVGVYATNDNWTPKMKKRIDELKIQFRNLGLDVAFSANPEKFPSDEIAKLYTLKMFSKVVDIGDPTVSYGALCSRSPYHAENPIDNDEFDKAYEKTIQAPDVSSRLAAMDHISKVIEKYAVIVPLLQKFAVYRINPATVHSLGAQLKPLFLDLAKVEMK